MHMQSQFHDHGTFKTFEHFDPSRTTTKLDPAVYEIEMIETQQGVQLRLSKRGTHFEQGGARYGAHEKYLSLIQENYHHESPSMGVMLVGIKGAGKSLFAEDLGNWGIRAQSVPVLMVMSSIPAPFIRKVVQAVGPCIIYFDEFGKTYEKVTLRDKMIALFSDSDMRGVMFVVTANDYNEFSDPMVDRPGRFRYRLHFAGLSAEDVAEVAAAHGLEEWQTVGLMRYVRTDRIGYDTLASVAEHIKGAKTEDEIRDRLEIINVPRWGWSGVNVVKLVENGKRLRFDKAAYDGQHLTVTCLEGEKFDIERIVQIPLQESRDWYRKAEADITISVGDFKLTFRVAPTGGGSSRVFAVMSNSRIRDPEDRAFVHFENRPRSVGKKETGDTPFDLSAGRGYTSANSPDFHAGIRDVMEDMDEEDRQEMASLFGAIAQAAAAGVG